MRELFKRRYKAFKIGPLPAAQINAALRTELEIADVWVSKAAHRHIAEDHSSDHEIVMANIIELIRSPSFVGQDPKHGDNFYLVRRVHTADGDEPILIAIGLEMSVHGTYSVRTAYRISNEDVMSRRMRGSLHSLLM